MNEFSSFLILFLIFAGILLIILSIVYVIWMIYFIYLYLFKKFTIFVPSRFSQGELEEFFQFLNSIEIPNKKFIDLGCGDGRVVREFAKRGYESYGVDVNYFLILLSKLFTKIQKIKNAYFEKKNFFDLDLKDFGLVYIYQLPDLNKILAEKFIKELKPQSVIISFKFPLPGKNNLKLIYQNKGFLVYKVI
jgi:SAM-dependent methyltransferase